VRYVIVTCIPLLAACSATSDEGVIPGAPDPDYAPSIDHDGQLSAEAPEAAACSVEADCTAAQACWTGTCVEGACVMAPLRAGSLCGDGACNGAGACTRGELTSVEVIGGAGHQYGQSIYGLDRGAVLLGAGPNEVTGEEGSFVRRSRYSGLATARQYAPTGDAIQSAAPIDGDIILAGCRETDSDGYDGVIQRMAQDGSPVWSTQFGGDGYQCAEHVAALPDGTVYVAGSFQHDLGLGGIASPSPKSFVAAFSPEGDLWWARTINAPAATVRGLQATPDGIVLAGHYEGTLQVGERSVSSLGRNDGFVTRLTPQGHTLWLVSVGGTGFDAVHNLAVSRKSVAISGLMDGASALGAVVMVADQDPFVARLALEDGQVRWARTLRTSAPVNIHALAVDDGGDVTIAGSFTGHFELDDVIDEDAGALDDIDAFVTKLASTDGTGLWAQTITEPGIQAFTGLATNTAGQVIASGTFEGRLGAEGPQADGLDGFITHLSR